MTYINQMKEGDRISGIYFCKSKASMLTKAGKEYFNVMIADKTGTLDTKVWDVDSPGINDFDQGDYIAIDGEIVSYNGQLQFKATRISVAKEGEYNLADFIASSKRDYNEMKEKFDGLIAGIKNKGYKKLLTSIFIDDKNTRKIFDDMGAAKTVHHVFLHGLLEHTLNVTNISLLVAKNYTDVNCDLVVATALLHDIGKIRELSSLPQSEYTDEGQLLGHIVMSYDIARDALKNVPELSDKEKNELLHCILAHHGSLEFGSPKAPMLMEAYIVSACDNIDAKLETIRETIENMKVTNKKDANGFVYNKFLGGNTRETTK